MCDTELFNLYNEESVILSCDLKLFSGDNNFAILY